MPRVYCPYCGREISFTTKVCPDCGYRKWRPSALGLSVGNSYIFGNYCGEDIEWRVLDVRDGASLLVSDKVIERRQYHRELVNNTWSGCSLRFWLNGEFLDTAFSATERARILKVDISNDGNEGYGTPGGPNTRDCVFCLSVDEVNHYFDHHAGSLICFPTKHAQYGKLGEAGLWTNDNGACRWWLRSPGGYTAGAVYVDSIGSIPKNGTPIDNWNVGVRPALWLSDTS